jgi:hypothetical protein
VGVLLDLLASTQHDTFARHGYRVARIKRGQPSGIRRVRRRGILDTQRRELRVNGLDDLRLHEKGRLTRGAHRHRRHGERNDEK